MHSNYKFSLGFPVFDNPDHDNEIHMIIFISISPGAFQKKVTGMPHSSIYKSSCHYPGRL